MRHAPTTARHDRRVREVRTTADLQPDRLNANRGTDRGRAALGTSLRDLGTGRSILIDRAGRILAGNKTAEHAKAMGLPIQIVRTDGGRLVVVQRTDLDLERDPKARELAIADNRVAELDLAWDPDVLRQLRADGVRLDGLVTPEEFDRLLAGTLSVGHTDENAVVEPAATDIQRGQLFQLGAHRLLCGDATDAKDVTRLLAGVVPRVMVTDPPYGVSYDPAWRHEVDPSQRHAVGRVLNDDRVDWSPAFHLFRGPVAYVWHAGLHAGTVARALEGADLIVRSQIVWHKPHFALSRGMYHWAHEPCWLAIRRGQRTHWRGDRAQSTVWTVPNLNAFGGGTRNAENAVTGHGTQKPVRLFETPIVNHTGAADAVYDPFVGSGTALIAAQKTGRSCFAMDLDPQYVQVALSRWEAYTGKRAVEIDRRRRRPRRLA